MEFDDAVHKGLQKEPVVTTRRGRKIPGTVESGGTPVPAPGGFDLDDLKQMGVLGATAAGGRSGRAGGARALEAEENQAAAGLEAALGSGRFDAAQGDRIPFAPGQAPYEFPTENPQSSSDALLEAIFGGSFDPEATDLGNEELLFRQEIFQTLLGAERQEAERVASIRQNEIAGTLQMYEQAGLQIPQEVLMSLYPDIDPSAFEPGANQTEGARFTEWVAGAGLKAEQAAFFTQGLSPVSIEASMAGGATGKGLEEESNAGRAWWEKVGTGLSAIGGTIGLAAGSRLFDGKEGEGSRKEIREYLGDNSVNFQAFEDEILAGISKKWTAEDLEGTLEDAVASGDLPKGFRDFMLNRWLPVIEERDARIAAFEAGA